jgi:hypothetical protein
MGFHILAHRYCGMLSLVFYSFFSTFYLFSPFSPFYLFIFVFYFPTILQILRYMCTCTNQINMHVFGYLYRVSVDFHSPIFLGFLSLAFPTAQHLSLSHT